MLENKIIFVAGACGRIGKALCQKILLSKGIPILADINKERLNKLQENLETNFKTKLLSLELDITKQESLQIALQKVKKDTAKSMLLLTQAILLAKIGVKRLIMNSNTNKFVKV